MITEVGRRFRRRYRMVVEAMPDELDELSEDLMETVSLGTRRFDNLLKKVS